MTLEQAEQLQPDDSVTVSGTPGVVDRVSGVFEIFVWFGAHADNDANMRVGVIGYQPSEVELVS